MPDVKWTSGWRGARRTYRAGAVPFIQLDICLAHLGTAVDVDKQVLGPVSVRQLASPAPPLGSLI